jgi:HlyD family secretion protein
MTPKLINTDKSLRRIQIAGFFSLILMVGTLGAWSVLANLNSAVIAPATIVVESYSKKVQHRDGGIVEKIMVKDGDRVEIGQDIVILDPTETRSELGIVDGLLDELIVKRSRLEAQRDGQTEMTLPPELLARAGEPKLANIVNGQRKLLTSVLESLSGKKQQYTQQIEQLNEQILGVDAQAESKKLQVKLIQGELVNLRKLQKQGLVPINRVLTMEREEASLQGQLGELKANRASALARIGEVNVQMLQIDEELRTQTLTELREAEGKITELSERRISASSRLGRMVIKSPITGTIYQSAVHTEGGVVGAGETLMLIVPEGDDLVLQAQVQPKDIDDIYENQAARVRFPSFNSRLTPEIDAIVSQVAADTTKMDQNTPPFYAVRLKIEAEALKKLGNNQLKPGMSAEAFIQTTARTPFDYFVRPLLDNFAHAFREL